MRGRSKKEKDGHLLYAGGKKDEEYLGILSYSLAVGLN